MDLLHDKKRQKSILGIDGWLSLEEGLLLYRFAKKLCRKGVLVEIGSFKGKSTVFIASALKEEHCGSVYAIDPHKGETTAGKKDYAPSLNAFLKNVRRFRVNTVVIPIKKTSEDASTAWKKPISLLFIDGLHDYFHAKQDLQLWQPHLVEDGVVACHDAFSPFPEVFRAVKEELFEKGNYRYISFANSILYAVKGKPASIIEAIKREFNKLVITLTSHIWHSQILPQQLQLFIITLLKKMIIKEKVFEVQKEFLPLL